MPEGLYFPGFGPADANPDMGDSAIVETVGLGGLAMAASPSVARFVGAGGMTEALAVTAQMREIVAAEHPHFRIPTLDDRGSPVGIDVRLVVETGITPLINTGIAGRKAGVGQVGAGVVRAALGCFTAALEALARLDLAERAERFPDELSGGESQRVAIARAVVGERHLLLADEPTGALDSVNGEAVMRLLRSACRDGVAGVVVTHDAQLASWADRVVFLRDGRVVDQTATRPGPESLLAPGAKP